MAHLKPANAAYRIWFDPPSRRRTPVSLVFLHGLSASPGEFGDIPAQMGRRLEANVYVARLPGHGYPAEDAMRGSTVAQWLACAEAALATGRQLGERVVLIGSSLGASLVTVLAARHPHAVAAVLAWSLGVRAADPEALARLCQASQPISRVPPLDPAVDRFWSAAVHPDAYRALDRFFGEWMQPSTAQAVRAPFLLAYWYQDTAHMDPVASVPAMLDLFQQLGTPPSRRRAIAYANGAHAIGSPWRSPVAMRVMEDSLVFVREQVAAPT
jgi:pimeloyl-ACP methyl ester carboxylesterase